MEKDYSLLRPFDIEAAKRGEKVCCIDGAPRTLILEAGPDGEHVFKSLSGNCFLSDGSSLRMAPLAWVEGKPVYKGDVLYQPQLSNIEYVADRIYRDTDGDVFLYYKNGWSSWIEGPLYDDSSSQVRVTWQKPKTKREAWANVYPDRLASLYETEVKANMYASKERVACVRIEWEE